MFIDPIFLRAGEQMCFPYQLNKEFKFQSGIWSNTMEWSDILLFMYGA